LSNAIGNPPRHLDSEALDVGASLAACGDGSFLNKKNGELL
jgi:hypothetical protein